MISYKLFQPYTDLVHFCTSRAGGVSVGNYASFNLNPFVGDQPSHFEKNKQLLCDKYGIQPGKLVIPFQTHGTEIRAIDERFFHLSEEEKSHYLHGVDALFTRMPEVCIGVTTADCVPLQFYDPVTKVVAVAHAGWRGTCGKIALKTIQKLTETFDVDPENLLITIGPSISGKVYEVGAELIDNFQEAGFDTTSLFEQRNNAIYLDLWEANRQLLLQAGVLPENIEIAGICTFTEHEKFFSARRLGIKSGRMLSGIMLK